ncbi:hypothetical protein [Dyadobacter alkalitolerans]|uniref:hypothetical protein n=1 Tax=Dyadobacter alkalitolerans TaxID=492736 RepID=UPI0004259EF4|nr:hypothetical protein [Dyadobacter alkalitolerans]
MATATVNRRESLHIERAKSKDSKVENEVAPPLSKQAQEAKIFLERNPIPKEFLKQN